jgi:hypothetical protein
MCKREIDELVECEDLQEADKANILHANAERFYNLAPVTFGSSATVASR